MQVLAKKKCHPDEHVFWKLAMASTSSRSAGDQWSHFVENHNSIGFRSSLRSNKPFSGGFAVPTCPLIRKVLVLAMCHRMKRDD